LLGTEQDPRRKYNRKCYANYTNGPARQRLEYDRENYRSEQSKKAPGMGRQASGQWRQCEENANGYRQDRPPNCNSARPEITHWYGVL
jgi:hypothetical protein